MNKRKLRFSPDEHNIIQLVSGETKVNGLIRDESFDGYCLIANHPFLLKMGDRVEILISNHPAGHGELVRIDQFGEVLVKIGVSIEI